MSERPIDLQLLEPYRRLVQEKHPNLIRVWPVLSGHNFATYSFGSWFIVFFIHTGNPVTTSGSAGSSLSVDEIGFSDINASNLPAVRSNLETRLRAKPEDAVVIVRNGGKIEDELNEMLARHERAMGLVPMKIFLSHSGADKPMVLEFYETLKTLGFDPWLDEKAMPAGTNLERGIREGFHQSCAAVFFITPNFKDRGFLATEVTYAVNEKRAKGNQFAIITIVIGSDDSVPDLLEQYVWKTPASPLGALQEILRALPVAPGPVRLKQLREAGKGSLAMRPSAAKGELLEAVSPGCQGETGGSPRPGRARLEPPTGPHPQPPPPSRWRGLLTPRPSQGPSAGTPKGPHPQPPPPSRWRGLLMPRCRPPGPWREPWRTTRFAGRSGGWQKDCGTTPLWASAHG